MASLQNSEGSAEPQSRLGITRRQTIVGLGLATAGAAGAALATWWNAHRPIEHHGFSLKTPKSADEALARLRAGNECYIEEHFDVGNLARTTARRAEVAPAQHPYAIVLACAGLSRLGWADRITERIDPDVCLPAFGQGILALECREDSVDLADRLRVACDAMTETVALAERELMRALGGGCKTAMAALAEPTGAGILLRGMVGDHRTGAVVRSRWEGATGDSVAAAREMAAELLSLAREEGIRLG